MTDKLVDTKNMNRSDKSPNDGAKLSQLVAQGYTLIINGSNNDCITSKDIGTESLLTLLRVLNEGEIHVTFHNRVAL